MGLANIANVPADQRSLDEWAFSHQAHHRDVIRSIRETVKIILPEYALDPLNPDDPGQWGYQHQQQHNAVNAILAVAGNDLVDVDWKNQEERQIWIDLNFSEHLRWNSILGV